MKKIMYFTWGYDMTNVDFYEVITETPKTALVEKIGAIETTTGYLCGTSVPDVEKRTGKTFRVCKRSFNGEEYYASRFDFGSVKYPRLWGGQPVGFNHCD